MPVEAKALHQRPESFEQFAVQLNNVGAPAAVFDSIDNSDRGYITRDELGNACSRLGLAITHMQLNHVLAVLDDNKSGTISRKQWVRQLTDAKPQQRQTQQTHQTQQQQQSYAAGLQLKVQASNQPYIAWLPVVVPTPSLFDTGLNLL